MAKAIALEKDPESDLRYVWEAFEKNEKGFPSIVEKQGTPLQFLTYFIQNLGGFGCHRFLTKHQHAAIETLKKTLPEHAVLLMRDYAEKLAIREKDETQQ